MTSYLAPRMSLCTLISSASHRITMSDSPWPAVPMSCSRSANSDSTQLILSLSCNLESRTTLWANVLKAMICNDSYVQLGLTAQKMLRWIEWDRDTSTRHIPENSVINIDYKPLHCHMCLMYHAPLPTDSLSLWGEMWWVLPIIWIIHTEILKLFMTPSWLLSKNIMTVLTGVSLLHLLPSYTWGQISPA